MTSVVRDGALALCALLGYIIVLEGTAVSVAPAWLLIGGLGAVVVEAAASRHRTRIRQFWNTAVVQLAALICVLVLAVGAAYAGSNPIVNLVAGGLIGYLLLLGLVASGLLTPPHRWGTNQNSD